MIIEEVVKFVTDNTGLASSADELDRVNNLLDGVRDKATKAFDEARGAIRSYNEEAKKNVRETARAETQAKRWNRSLQGVKASIADQVKSFRILGVEVGQYQEAISLARSGSASFRQGLTQAGVAAGNVRKVMLALNLSLGLIGVAIVAVVAALSIFIAASRRSQRIADAFADAGAALSATLDVLLDRVAAVGEALFDFVRGKAGVITTLERFGEATSGVTAEIVKEAQAAAQLARELRAVDRQLRDLEVTQAAYSTRLRELERIAGDGTKGVRNQIAAERERADIVIGGLEEEIRLRRQGVAAALNGTTEVTESTLAQIDAIKQFGVGLNATFANTRATDATREEVAELVKELIDLEDALAAEQFANEDNIRGIRKAAFEEYKKQQEEALRLEQAVNEARENVLEQLREAQEGDFTGEQAIERDRRLAAVRINELEKVTREVFKQAGEQFNLEEAFINLRLEAEAKANRELQKLRFEEQQDAIDAARERAEAEIDLLTISGDEELSLAEFKAQQRAQLQRDSLRELRKITEEEFGPDSLEVLRIDLQIQDAEQAATDAVIGGAERRRQELIESNDLQRQLANARIDLLEESGEKELSLEQFKAREKLGIERDFLEKKLEILASDPAADSAQLELLRLQIQQLDQQIEAIGDTDLSPLERIKQGIINALNIDEQTLKLLGQQISGIFNNVAEGIAANIDRQIAEYDRLLEELEDQISETEGLLEEQLQRREEGFSNNVEVYEEQLAQETAARDKALKERAELEKRAARQQLIVDAATQASALAVAASQLIAAEASKGLIGIVIAAGALATAFSLFTRYKAAAAAATADIPTFEKGFNLEYGYQEGPSHRQGGIKLKDQFDRWYEIQGGEFVTNVDSTRKYQPALEAMNTGAMDNMTDLEALRLLGRDTSVPQVSSVTAGKSSSRDYGQLEEIVSKNVGKVVDAVGANTSEQVLPDGRIVRRTETKTRRTTTIISTFY
ncbi:hypothetical protein [Lewinella sp. W8]|uniref:hypothetical protein n=1 Tax=Lewinella sp. W8 TaxID=2528208 RepID=UPI001068340F|nr:hypothetical protein [Lewinella sp. W8]MTB53033.1 hypothetical protein [Lewinella sp. W8]